MSKQRIQWLRNQLVRAKQAYYYGGSPILSDAEYDALEAELRQRVPADALLASVGAPVPPETVLSKAKHQTPMGSQNKVNTGAEFGAWYKKSCGHDGLVQASLKADGASAAAYYDRGRLVQVVSRGDGFEGEDITANAIKFKGLPAYLDDGTTEFCGAIRFEVILTVEDWGRVDPDRSTNPRNAGAGIMGRKTGEQSELLSAYAFNIEERRDGQAYDFKTEQEKAERLIQLGFSVLPFRLCSTASEVESYYEEIVRTRDTLPFWIDGVVLKVNDIVAQRALGVTANRPKGQVAWKFDSQGAETTLLAYSVSVGHTGALVPTAHLEPVQIGGTTVSNALLNNWDEIERLDVAVGDRVWLIKANDIIPKITHVVSQPKHRSRIPKPQSCPVCGGDVERRRNSAGEEGVIIECANPECEAKALGKLKRWITALDIQGIGDSVRVALVEQMGIEDAAGLYSLKERQVELSALVINRDKEIRLGDKRAATIVKSVESTRSLNLVQFLGSLGIERLGQRRVELMIGAAAGDLDTLQDWLSGRIAQDEEFAARVGVPTVGAQIQRSLDAQRGVIDRLIAAKVSISGTGVAVCPDPTEAAQRKTLCISGKLPSGKSKADYKEPLAAVGLQLVDSVTKGLGWLVVSDPNLASSKAKKAKKHGIPVISEDELSELVRSRTV